MTPSDLSRDPPEGLEPHVGNLWNKPKLRMKKFKLAPPQPATHDIDIFSLALELDIVSVYQRIKTAKNTKRDKATTQTKLQRKKIKK